MLNLAQHITANRRGDGRPTATVLDYGGADVAWGANRRKSDEKSVVALLPRNFSDLAQAVITFIFRDAAHLGSTRFAAHGQARLDNPRRVSGPARFIDDCAHPIKHKSDGIGVEPQFRKVCRYIAARRHHARFANEVGNYRPAGDQAGDHRRDL